MSKTPIIAGVVVVVLIVLGVVVYMKMGGEKSVAPTMAPAAQVAPTMAPAAPVAPAPTSIKSLEILSNVPNSATLTGIQANSPSAFNAKRKAVLVATIAIDSNSEGVIFESGATGRGVVLYAFDGTLYCQAGQGNVAGGTIEVSWTIPSTLSKTKKTEVGVSFDVSATPSRARLFIDGVEVYSTTSGATPSLSGPDLAGSGKKYGGISVTRLTPYADYSDTIYDLTLYPDVYIEA